jgi:hypothetical protein
MLPVRRAAHDGFEAAALSDWICPVNALRESSDLNAALDQSPDS